jgi:hypothetical protein
MRDELVSTRALKRWHAREVAHGIDSFMVFFADDHSRVRETAAALVAHAVDNVPDRRGHFQVVDAVVEKVFPFARAVLRGGDLYEQCEEVRAAFLRVVAALTARPAYWSSVDPDSGYVADIVDVVVIGLQDKGPDCNVRPSYLLHEIF